MRILVIGGWAKSLLNFRGPLIRALHAQGHTVLASAAEDDTEVLDTLSSWGVVYHPTPLDRASTNPLSDLRYLRALIRLMRLTTPDVVIAYTHKPVLFGTWAACHCKVPRRTALITGLGYAFIPSGRLRQRISHAMVCTLYRALLPRCEHVFFQNEDDRDLFRAKGILKSQPHSIIPGSGVDLEYFAPQPVPGGHVHFLLIARLLRDKGIVEFVEAARQVRARHPEVVFQLVGPFDPNPAALREDEIQSWVDEGCIEYLGMKADVREILGAATVYVMPSYREGTPRTVLEAMATGRAIITTDVPGCRQTIRDAKEGFIVAPHSAEALASAMQCFIDDSTLAERMGASALKRARDVYDVHRVNRIILEQLDLTREENEKAPHRETHD